MTNKVTKFNTYEEAVSYLEERHPVFYKASINSVEGLMTLPNEVTDLLCTCECKTVIHMIHTPNIELSILIALYSECYEALGKLSISPYDIEIGRAQLKDIANGMLTVMSLLGYEVPLRIPELGNMVRL